MGVSDSVGGLADQRSVGEGQGNYYSSGAISLSHNHKQVVT